MQASLPCRFLWVVVCAVLPTGLLADPLETAQKSAGEWVKLRVETTRMEQTWQEERSLVESMLAAANERAQAAEEKRDLVKARTAKEREELETLRAKNTTEAEDLRLLDTRLQELTAKLIALRPSLPPRLSEALEMPYRSLAGAQQGPGERMQLAMIVLNRCAQFNRVVTLAEDVLTLDGEPAPRSLEVIYWGLSQGYAIDRTTQRVWRGSPGPGGWQWVLQPEAFASVAELIAVARDKADPHFVAVPAIVTRRETESVRGATP